MYLNNNSFLSLSLVVAFSFSSLGLVIGCIFSSNIGYAQQQLQGFNLSQNNITNANNILSVIGTATTIEKPDKVIISLGVETTNKTANTALTANSNIMNKVIGALKTTGVRENETSTPSFNISPNYNYSQSSGNTGRTIIGFTVSNTIQIESTNIQNVSKWIDTAIAAGANVVNNIDFTFSDKKLQDTKTSLIKKAIADARTKADTAASAAGLKVIEIKSINLNDFAIPPTLPYYPTPSAKESLTLGATTTTTNNRSTPVILGQQQVTLNISIVFVIG
jgi:uncharacterized protein YggE